MDFVAIVIRLLILGLFTAGCVASRTDNLQRIMEHEFTRPFTGGYLDRFKREDKVDEKNLKKEEAVHGMKPNESPLLPKKPLTKAKASCDRVCMFFRYR